MKSGKTKIKKIKYNVVKNFVIFNILILLLIYLSFLTDYFNAGISLIFMIAAYPLFTYLLENLISDGIIFIILYLLFTLVVCNFWFYLFVRKKKGGRKKEVIALIIYLVLMSLLWLFWVASSVFAL